MFRTFLATAAACVCLLATPRAQEELEGQVKAQVKALEGAIQALRLTPGLALTVNGETVPPEAWQRTLVYLKGRSLIDERILLFIIDERVEELVKEKIRKQKAALVEPSIQARLKEEEKKFQEANPGKSWDEHLQAIDSSRADLLMEWREEMIAKLTIPREKEIAEQTRKGFYALSQNEVQARIDMSVKEFKQKKPGEEFWDYIQLMGYTKEEYKAIVRSTMLFGRLFFPGKPWDWPAITKEAIYNNSNGQGKQFFESLEKSMRANPKAQVPPFFINVFQKWVMDALKKWAEIKYASDGLHPRAVVSFNGREYSTLDAYRRIKSKISEIDRNRALREIVLTTALRQALNEADCWPTAAQYEKAWKDHAKPYEGSPFTVEVMATVFRGYPSIEVYRNRFRLMEGYRLLLERKGLLTDKQLQEFLPEVTSFLGEAAIDTQLIRFPARDDATGRWIPGGYAAARARAEMVMKSLEMGELSFAEAMAKGTWAKHVKHGGNFVRKVRNELRKELGENEYNDFVFGYSVGDILCDKAPEGKVVGPLCGLDGYYIGMVSKRHRPAKPVQLSNPQMKEMVQQEYLVRRFLQWANQVAAGTEVR